MPARFHVALISLLAVTFASAQEITLRSESNVVLVPALVKDSQGHAVFGLHAKDFIVEDEGTAQPAQLDEAAESEPISLVVAIQRGGAVKRELPRIQGLRSMLDPVLSQDQTRTAVVEFDHEVELVQDFTDDQSLVEKTLRDLHATYSGAAILDAVAYSVNLLNQQPAGRQRVLLLISETRDHGSIWARKIEDLVTLIGDSNTVVYALTFSPALSNILDTERGSNRDDMHMMPNLLAPLIMAAEAMKKNSPKSIAAMTGGEYELFDTRKGFESRMNDFTNHLHSRYLLSFQPKDPHPGLHELRVRLRDPEKGNVLARGSYWAKGAP